MDVSGAESIGGAGPVRRSPSRSADKGSPAAADPDAPPTGPADRAEKLARIRAEIEAGTYETPEKLEAAVERLLSEIG